MTTNVRSYGFPCCCLSYEEPPPDTSETIFKEAERLVEVCRVRFAKNRGDRSIALEAFRIQLEKCANVVETTQNRDEKYRLKGRYDVWSQQYIQFARQLGYKDTPRRLSVVVVVQQRKS